MEGLRTDSREMQAVTRPGHACPAHDLWEHSQARPERWFPEPWLASWHTELIAAPPGGEERFAQGRSVAKQNIDCKVLKCALSIQLSFLTSRNCTRRGCSYPPLKHLAPPGTGYCARWSAGLGCYGNSWLPKLFIFPLQWPTKRCTGSLARFLWVGLLTLCPPASCLLFKKQQRKCSHSLAAKQVRTCNPCPAELCEAVWH